MKNRFYDINSKETVRLAAEENAPGDEQAMIEQIAAIYRRIEALPEQETPHLQDDLHRAQKLRRDGPPAFALAPHREDPHVALVQSPAQNVDVLPHAFRSRTAGVRPNRF